jgi:hypothetical protein
VPFLGIGIWAGSPPVAMAVELAALAWAVFEAHRRRRESSDAQRTIPPPLLIPTVTALTIVIGTSIAANVWAWEANPNGEWDGWAIWNLRARFLASQPSLANRAWSAELGRATHAEYPLLVSGFIARAWRYSSSFSMAVPAATSFLFWLALVAMVLAAIAALRGRSLGILAALALAATPAILRQVPRQYADVPLACYFAGAVLMALLDRPLLAGFFAGLATWTKDEGLLFLLVFLAAMTIFRFKSVLLALISALPGAILALTFKLVIVKGTPSLVAASVAGAAQRISDLERWGTIVTAYCKEFLALGDGWYHPILPLAALAISLRLDCARRRHMNFCVAIVGGLLAGYFAFYVITPTPLKWQLQNSLNRLFVQVWPLVVLAVAAGLNPPESAAILGEELKVRPKAKNKRVQKS